jgi:hypothetical protein
VIAQGTLSWRVAITNVVAAGWRHIVVVWQSTNYSIYVDAIRHPHIYYSSGSDPAGVTNSGEYWIGGLLISTGQMMRATVDDFALLTNTWTAAQIGADFTNSRARHQ